jgi:hypothetical protein
MYPAYLRYSQSGLRHISYSKISLNSRTFPTIYTELEKAEFPLQGILEDTLLDEECNDHGYVPFVVITIWS